MHLSMSYKKCFEMGLISPVDWIGAKRVINRVDGAHERPKD